MCKYVSQNQTKTTYMVIEYLDSKAEYILKYDFRLYYWLQ